MDIGYLGRYSFLGIDPFYILETKGRDPFEKLRQLLEEYKFSSPINIPFLGGAVGYLSYDLGVILEKKVKPKAADAIKLPDCFFGFYNTVVIADNIKNKLYIFSVGFPEKKHHLGKLLCEANVKKIEKLLSQVNALRISAGRSADNIYSVKLSSNFTRDKYISAIKMAKDYIRRGDIYQVNLSQQFNTITDLSSLQIYQRLRKLSPTCFSAYLDAGDYQILSSSPERFLSLERNIVTTRPMKGTRPRGRYSFKDKGFKNQLLNSAKDKAELVMIVDLERNDLGRVCDYDSVKVNVLRELEEYSTVFQTTATISGRLHKNKDRVDLLRACFPGGSITGCPKIRSMEIIEELEPTKRSVYTGSLGYLSFSGNMDFNILIRTILKKAGDLYFSVGGGIVADSNPEAEYQETLVKAIAMKQAIS